MSFNPPSPPPRPPPHHFGPPPSGTWSSAPPSPFSGAAPPVHPAWTGPASYPPPSLPMQMPPSYPPPAASSSSRVLVWIFAVGALVVLLGTCGVVGTTLTLAAIGASAEEQGGVQLGAQISETRLAKLRQRGLINDQTKVIAFYDASVSLDMSEVALLTTRELIHANGPAVARVEVAEISSVDHRVEAMMDVIEVATTDGTHMRIEVAVFNGGVSFLNALEDELQRQGSPAVVHRQKPR